MSRLYSVVLVVVVMVAGVTLADVVHQCRSQLALLEQQQRQIRLLEQKIAVAQRHAELAGEGVNVLADKMSSQEIAQRVLGDAAETYERPRTAAQTDPFGDLLVVLGETFIQLFGGIDLDAPAK